MDDKKISKDKISEEKISAEEILSDEKLENVAGGTDTGPGEMFFLHDKFINPDIDYCTQGGHG